MIAQAWLPDFAQPALWPLLLLVPAAWLLLRLVAQRRRVRLLRLMSPERAPALCREVAPTVRRIQGVLWLSALACAIVAVLQPLFGEEVRKIEQRGVDIVVCLDVSRSMLARDLPPDRLTRARREIKALAERIHGDRLALVPFAGEARLTVPLTPDMDTFAGLVELADPYSVTRGGTDLGAALDTALKALDTATGDHEVVLLLTDGEDLAGRGKAVAEKAKERNITIHCVGFGTPLGSKIAVGDGGGETFLRGPRGEEVVSTMDVEGLRRIAETTGGEFVRADAMPLPLVELYEKRVLPKAKKAFEAEDSREKKNRYQWPLLLAFVLWILETALSDRRRASS